MIVAIALLFALAITSVSDAPRKIDFGNDATVATEWVVISDNVMGGISTSSAVYTSTSVILSGDISLANYGGFSSIKTKFRPFDLSKFKGVKIRFKSRNQTFAFTLEDSRNWTQPNYKSTFSSKSVDKWEEVTLNFSEFKEYVVGEPTGNAMDLRRLSNIVRIGFITNDKKQGPFTLEVDYIEFVP
jgi:hypothetical protein